MGVAVTSDDQVVRDRVFSTEFQQALAGISARFVTVSELKFDAAVDFALARLGNLFAVDRAYLFRFSPDMARMSNTHEWCAPGIAPQKERASRMPVDGMPWWKAHITTKGALHIPDVRALPNEAAAERAEFEAQEIQSLICLPLRNPDERLIGFIGFDAVAAPYTWSPDDIRMLQVVAEIVAGAIARHEANQALCAHHLRFEQLAELSRVMVWEIDEAGRFTYVSPSCLLLTGYQPAELVGKKHIYELHPEEGRPAFRKQTLEGISRRAPFRNLQNPIQTKSGSCVWVSTNAAPVFDAQGEWIGYRGSDADITERRTADEVVARAREELERHVEERTAALQEANRRLEEGDSRYHRIVQATHSFVFSVQIEQGREMATCHDAEVELISGYTAEEYARDPALWQKTVHPDDMPQLLEHIQSLKAGTPIAVLDHRLVRKDGSIRWVRNTSVLRKDASGQVRGYDGLITDITPLKEAESERDELLESLRKMTRHDSMTGLLNRRGFYEELEHLWNLSRRHPFPIGLLIFDLDHFKTVNDTYGHLIGDAVIIEYAQLIKSFLRDSDVICRYAGDELVVILPWTDLQEARLIGQRMCEKVAEHVFCKGTHDLHLTVSIGAYAKVPQAGRTMERLLNLTDRALYRAKQNGRNRLCGVDELFGGATEEEGVTAPPPSPAMPKQGQVLVVDDEPEVRRMLCRALEQEGFAVRTAAGFHEALELAEHEKGLIDVAMIDLHLNGRSGLELVDRFRAAYPTMVLLVVTGQPTTDAAVESLRSGVYDFVQKPLPLSSLSALMRRAMQQRRLLLENQRYQDHLEAMVRQRGQSLAKALEEQKHSYRFTLEAMAALINARERETGEHCRRVAQMAVILAAELGSTAEELEQIRSGALLHDIGKIAIPDAILLKPGPLDETEWTVMKTHPEIGYEIIANSPALKEAADIVRNHQERYDGTGYPRGLKGEEICLGGRIFSVVDAYDAMRSDRPYKKAMSPEDTLNEILRHKATQFDPYVVEALLRCIPQIEAEGRW